MHTRYALPTRRKQQQEEKENEKKKQSKIANRISCQFYASATRFISEIQKQQQKDDASVSKK